MNHSQVTEVGVSGLDKFSSLGAMKTVHSQLLKRLRSEEDGSVLTREVEKFIQMGQATGVVIDADTDRQNAQSMLDYWYTILLRSGVELPDTILFDFDPELAPELDDSLCPYRGLDAFNEQNQAHFFGREALIDRMNEHLTTHRLLIVVGPSGSGKSSVVLAGLLPKLKQGSTPGSAEWRYYARMVPGSNPIENLIRIIMPPKADKDLWVHNQFPLFMNSYQHLTNLINSQGSSPAVLVIDQFEETFTLCHDDRVRNAFINNLLGLLRYPRLRHTVILTMRTDFESQVARVPELLEIYERNNVRVTAMDAASLRTAIEKPAELVGLRFDEGLVDDLIREVLGEPAALPLLQFTLLKLWENRERNRVTWESYRKLGGGREALARSANQFYEDLIPEDQITCKRILLKLAQPGEGLEVTSNRIRRKDIYTIAEASDRIDRVLDRLIRERLVRQTYGRTQADVQIEVAHEALIRNWPRLVNWIEEDRVKMRKRRRLTVMAEQWFAIGKDPSALLRGRLLEEALTYDDLNQLEAEFVRTSHTTQETTQAQEAEQKQQLAKLMKWITRFATFLSANWLISFIIFIIVFSSDAYALLCVAGLLLMLQVVASIATIILSVRLIKFRNVKLV